MNLSIILPILQGLMILVPSVILFYIVIKAPCHRYFVDFILTTVAVIFVIAFCWILGIVMFNI